MIHTPVIETARLRLRELVLADADALHAVYGDAEAMTWWSHPPHTSIDETRAGVAKRVGAKDWRAWAITLADNDRAIGTLGANEKRQGRVVEIGYSLARPHWRRGLASEAVVALLDLLFVEGARRVYADTDPDNAASNALLKKLGFTLEARLRAEWETHLGVRDSLIWGMLAQEWRPGGPRA